MRDRIVFACEEGGFERSRGLLGGFDGRDARDLHAYAVRPGDEQLLVSIHENLHHELQWSTGWGLIAAMTGLLAGGGVEPKRSAAVAALANSGARQVHETFATTISVGVLGVPKGRALLAGNERYLGYLDVGLALGGPAQAACWQFRESAAQMLLRAFMQPRELADVLGDGLNGIRLAALAGVLAPDRRLDRAAAAGNWWPEVFARILRDHRDRGGDTGGTWSRDLPEDADRMERLREFEETVLIPELAHEAATRLERSGIHTLTEAEYLDIVTGLRASFTALAPQDWQVEVLTDRRPMAHEPLGAERERVTIRQTPAAGKLYDAGQITANASLFLHDDGSGQSTILAAYLLGDAYATQFALLELAGKPPILALAGWPSDHDGRVPLCLLKPGMPPADLAGVFTSLPVVTLTSLSVTRDQPFRDRVLALDEVFVLIDLPLNLQIRFWIDDGWTVRVAAIDLRAPNGLTLLIFHLDELPGVWFLAYRSIAGFGELAQLLDRHPDRLLTGIVPQPTVMARIGLVSSWLMAAWWRFQEAENL